MTPREILVHLVELERHLNIETATRVAFLESVTARLSELQRAIAEVDRELEQHYMGHP